MVTKPQSQTDDDGLYSGWWVGPLVILVTVILTSILTAACLVLLGAAWR